MGTPHSVRETRVHRSPGTVRVSRALTVVLIPTLLFALPVLVLQILTTLLLLLIFTRVRVGRRAGARRRCRTLGGFRLVIICAVLRILVLLVRVLPVLLLFRVLLLLLDAVLVFVCGVVGITRLALTAGLALVTGLIGLAATAAACGLAGRDQISASW